MTAGGSTVVTTRVRACSWNTRNCCSSSSRRASLMRAVRGHRIGFASAAGAATTVTASAAPTSTAANVRLTKGERRRDPQRKD